MNDIKDIIKRTLFLFTSLILITIVLCFLIAYAHDKVCVECNKTETKELVITEPVQNEYGTVYIEHQEEGNKTEVIHGMIKVINDGKDGKEQCYIIYEGYEQKD